MGAIDAKTLRVPIVCSVEDITPVQMSSKDIRRPQRSIEDLQQVAEHNNSAHNRAVSALVRMTGSARAIKVNQERNRR